MKITIENEVVPSGNVLKGHWAVKAKHIEHWKSLLHENTNQSDWKKRKPQKYNVTITRHSLKQLDIANLYHSADKLILDNIKSNTRERIPSTKGYTFKSIIVPGLIFDDNPKNINLQCFQEPSSGRVTSRCCNAKVKTEKFKIGRRIIKNHTCKKCNSTCCINIDQRMEIIIDISKEV